MAVAIEERITIGVDDGYSRIGGYFVPTGNEAWAGDQAIGTVSAWFRFASVTIPVGSTITSAYVRFYSDSVNINVYLRVKADDQADPAAPSNQADHAGRARTTNSSVQWHPTHTAWAWVNSPSIVTVIQELVDSYDYSTGKAIQILLDDDGSSNGAHHDAKTIEEALNHEAYLRIEYDPPAVVGGGGSSGVLAIATGQI